VVGTLNPDATPLYRGDGVISRITEDGFDRGDGCPDDGRRVVLPGIEVAFPFSLTLSLSFPRRSMKRIRCYIKQNEFHQRGDFWKKDNY